MIEKTKKLQSAVEVERRRIKELEKVLARAEGELQEHFASCKHNFRVTYDPIHYAGYFSPGDPDYVHGPDKRLPSHIPAETKDRWRRECPKCGLVEYTQSSNTRTQEIKEPAWRT
jgi:phage FluMu protein Com